MISALNAQVNAACISSDLYSMKAPSAVMSLCKISRNRIIAALSNMATNIVR